MYTRRFLYGGLHLGEADIMRQQKLDGTDVIKKAVTQFNTSGSKYGTAAAGIARQIEADFRRRASQVHQARIEAQKEPGAGYQAVSCGWWLGQAYGCCVHGADDKSDAELMGYIVEAVKHANALSAMGGSGWSVGKIETEFGPVAEAIGGFVGIEAMKAYAATMEPKITAFAGSLR